MANKKETKVCDHMGNVFATITQMCDYYNVTRNAFNHRIARGASLAEALTTPVRATVKHSFNSDAERKEYIHQYRLAYYQAHRDEALTESKAYYQSHRDEYLAYQKEYRKKHNDYFRGYQAAKHKYSRKESTENE